MAVSRSQISQWVGQGIAVRSERFNASNWRRPQWRVERMRERARIGRFYVYDEPGPKPDQRRVWFAIP